MNIEVESVGYDLHERTLFDNVSFSARAGLVTSLVGASGSGKTTLLHCLGLLQTPTRGRIVLSGEDATRWTTSRRRRFWAESAAFVLQDYGLVEEESVAFNVSMSKSVFLGRTKGDADRVSAALDLTGLGGRENARAVSLSGGEKQRLAIARAIYKNAAVIYVDEPTASLDAANRAHVAGLLRHLATIGRCVIAATHDEQLVEESDLQVRLEADGTNAIYRRRDTPAMATTFGKAA